MKRQRAKRILALLLCCLSLLSCQIGCQIPPEAKKETQIYQALIAEKETIWLPLYGMHTGEAHTLYSTLLATRPELFYVSPYYTACAGVGDYVAYLKPEYRLTGEALIEAKRDYLSRLTPLLSPAKEMGSAREQLLYLHDYLTRFFTYDENQSIYDAYSLLVEGRGVCQAFSLLFFDLCERLGIPSEIVICPTMRHQWNRVCLDGVWLEVDLVWDLVLGADSYFLIPHEDLHAARVARDPAWQEATYFYYG